MKDWEVLSIVANAAANIRMPVSNKRPSLKLVDEMQALVVAEEQSSTSLSPDLFTDELIEACRRTFLGAYLVGWGLTTTGSYDLEALEKFLKQRYGLRSDDVEHSDFFGSKMKRTIQLPATSEQAL